MKLGFAFNQDNCIGCKACQYACKDRQDLEVGTLFREVYSVNGGEFPEVVNFFVSMSCNHCDIPVCLEACPVDAISKREDGIVLIDQEICIACGACRAACPYNAPSLEEDKGKMGKCDFCVDRLANGQKPMCVASCLTRALDYGDIKELKKTYGKSQDGPEIPEPKTEPNFVIVNHRDTDKL